MTDIDCLIYILLATSGTLILYKTMHNLSNNIVGLCQGDDLANY